MRRDLTEHVFQLFLVFFDTLATGHIEVNSTGDISNLLHDVRVGTGSQTDRYHWILGVGGQLSLFKQILIRGTGRQIRLAVGHQHDHLESAAS